MDQRDLASVIKKKIPTARARATRFVRNAVFVRCDGCRASFRQADAYEIPELHQYLCEKCWLKSLDKAKGVAFGH